MNPSSKICSDFGSQNKSHKSEKKTKEKKHKKKKSKKKKLKKQSESSDECSNSSGGEWKEQSSSPDLKSMNTLPSSNIDKEDNPSVRDEWMSLPGLFPSVTKERKQPKKPNDSNKVKLDELGQSKYELNPYWKSGGTGLPAADKEVTTSVGTVGDLGANWLRRALTRAKEQAAEEGCSLEDVAAERWGSLAKLETLLAEAEARSSHTSRNRPEREDRYREDRRASLNRREERNDSRDDRRYSHRDRRDEKPRRDAVEESRSVDRSRVFQRPRGDDDDGDTSKPRDLHRSHASRSRGREGGWRRRVGDESKPSSSSRKPGDNYSPGLQKEREKSEDRTQSLFKKPMEESSIGRSTQEIPSSIKSKDVVSKPSRSHSSSDDMEEDVKPRKTETETSNRSAALTDKEMNDLGAKLVKAEILGNETLAAELKQKLDAARACRLVAPPCSAEAEVEAQVVVLTRTDARGFTRPVAAAAEPYGGRHKKRRVETHNKEGQRVRYFPDDDGVSLKEMFESEKLNTVEDSNKMFSDMASKVKPNDDMADIFEDRACRDQSAGKREARERSLAIGESRKNERALDTCVKCFDSKLMLKHLVISIGTKVYLSLPPQQSLTEGHCFIIPLNHCPCSTQLDEDVWTEIQAFRRALVAMFLTMDQDVVFVETAMHLRKFPHMWLECIPMPSETGHLAPIYFKKAILECEMEWSTNRKLVDTSKKDVRRSIPKGLPYFSVDFGNEGGFAHVIEDESAFPSNFAQEIVGGMLDLDHRLWRKPQKENFDAQRKKVLQFAQWWKPHDFTARANASDSDSS